MVKKPSANDIIYGIKNVYFYIKYIQNRARYRENRLKDFYEILRNCVVNKYTWTDLKV